MNKKIIFPLVTAAAIVAGVAVFSAFEAHVINVTAHIENALSVSTHGIDFGTVFPQEMVDEPFTISLSDSFKAETNVGDVSYKLVQKDKPWTLNFGEIGDVNAHNRTLVFVDPDPGKGEGHTIGGGKLTITTGNDVEDLYGPNEPTPGNDWTAPRMVIPMGGNFTIETKVTASPNAYPPNPYQSAGILVYGSNGNVVRLELTGFSGLGGPAVYMESQESGVKVGKGWNSLGGVVPATVYLRLSRNGNAFSGEYSADGIAWNPVIPQEVFDFDNAAVGNQPEVGLAVVDNNGDSSNTSFSADFDYVTFNGGYLSLCKFLSKTLVTPENGDVAEPSYFNGSSCRAINDSVPQASGTLNRTSDLSDEWLVDLKVPPIVGYVGQDWPVSCAPWIVQENDMDYGCDIWVEVTGFTR